MKSNIKTTKKMLKFYNQRVKEKKIDDYGEKEGARKYNYDRAFANAISLLCLGRDDMVLDVGCGSGVFSVRFAKKCSYVCSTDISIEMLKVAKRRAKRHNVRIDFVVADAEHLPFKNKSFDHSACFQVLHHVTKPINSVLEMKRISNKKVLSWEPNKYNPFHIVRRRIRKTKMSKDFNPDLHDYSVPEWVDLFRKAGLQDVHSKTATFIPWDTPNYLFDLFKVMDRILEHTPLVRGLGGNSLIVGNSIFKSKTHVPRRLLDILACPVCKSDLQEFQKNLFCKKCEKIFKVEEGIPILLPF